MVLTGLDTNILIRFVTKDHPAQLAAIIGYMEIMPGGEHCYIGVITLCEAMWVLRSSYRYSKNQLLQLLETIMQSDDFLIEDQSLVETAFEQYRATKIGLADILIGLRNRNAGCTTTLTFDKAAATLDEFTLLA